MDKKLYTPAEVAKRLGISTYQLRYMRQTGRIEGVFVGNTTLYTEEQILAADLSKRTPGVKPSKKTLTSRDNGNGSGSARACA